MGKPPLTIKSTLNYRYCRYWLRDNNAGLCKSLLSIYSKQFIFNQTILNNVINFMTVQTDFEFLSPEYREIVQRPLPTLYTLALIIYKFNNITIAKMLV